MPGIEPGASACKATELYNLQEGTKLQCQTDSI